MIRFRALERIDDMWTYQPPLTYEDVDEMRAGPFSPFLSFFSSSNDGRAGSSFAERKGCRRRAHENALDRVEVEGVERSDSNRARHNDLRQIVRT
jgi:hypothetical protein